jgi:hypothetical protein
MYIKRQKQNKQTKNKTNKQKTKQKQKQKTNRCHKKWRLHLQCAYYFLT